jgi:hypothetical protein
VVIQIVLMARREWGEERCAEKVENIKGIPGHSSKDIPDPSPSVAKPILNLSNQRLLKVDKKLQFLTFCFDSHLPSIR